MKNAHAVLIASGMLLAGYVLGVGRDGGRELREGVELSGADALAALDAIRSGVSSLSERIDGLELNVAQRAGGIGMREPAVPDPANGTKMFATKNPAELDSPALANLDKNLELIRSHLKQIEENLREGVWFDPPPTIQEMGAGKEYRDWNEIETIYNLSQGAAESSAIDAIRFRSYVDTLSQFGPPTAIDSSGSWWYVRDRAEGKPRQFVLGFRNGFVSFVQFHK